MSAEVNSPFGKLPVEMKSKLFTFLNNKDRMTARLVCRSWLPIATEMVKFFGVITDETKQLVQKCGYQFQSLSLQNLSVPIQMSSYFKSFPDVKEYVIGRGNSVRTIHNFLRYFANNIQNLTIQNLAFSNLKIRNYGGGWLSPTSLSTALPGIKWSSLSSLSLTMKSVGIGKNDSDDYKDHLHAIKEKYLSHSQAIKEILQYVRVKTLKNLTIELFTGQNRETKKPWNKIVNFILEHSESLRELRLGLFGKPIPDNPYTTRYNQWSLGHFGRLKLQKISFKYDVYHSIFAQALSLQMRGVECLDLQGDLRMMSRKGIKIEDDKYFAKALDTHIRNFNPEYTIGLRASTLRTICCKSQLISFQWSGSFNNLKEIELKIIELRSYSGFPFFPVLTKFCIHSEKTPKIFVFVTLFCRGIVTCMPNVKELELIFLDAFFEIHNFQDLRDLQKLRKVTIGKISMEDADDSWELYCEETPGLLFTFKRIEDLSELSVKSPFACAVIRIDYPKICLSKVEEKVQQET